MLTKEFRDEHSEVPWRDIIDMRNVLVHGYYVASPLFIWETYQKDLPPLRESICQYIEDVKRQVASLQNELTELKRQHELDHSMQELNSKRSELELEAAEYEKNVGSLGLTFQVQGENN